MAEKVVAGERLSFADGVLLATTSDLLGVGRLANFVRERLHGNATFFNVNRHLNPTNVCVASCALCAFAEKYGGARGWTYTVEEAVEVAARDVTEDVTELHIVGGLHPKLGVEYYEAFFAALSARFPWVHLKALTMVEIDFLAQRAKLPVEEVVRRLAAAGLDSCPGGGAEIFAERVRAVICDHKTSGERWLEIARAVHGARHQVELHDAVRPHRDGRGAGRSPRPPARAAGRDRRLPVLHPARLPPGQHPPRPRRAEHRPARPADRGARRA